jgi:hypothetical protein
MIHAKVFVICKSEITSEEIMLGGFKIPSWHYAMFI